MSPPSSRIDASRQRWTHVLAVYLYNNEFFIFVNRQARFKALDNNSKSSYTEAVYKHCLGSLEDGPVCKKIDFVIPLQIKGLEEEKSPGGADFDYEPVIKWSSDL